MASDTLPPDEKKPPHQWENQEPGTFVPSSHPAEIDKLVARFNELNRTIVSGLPEMARAYDTLHRHLPLLREMQSLLSQRPKGLHGSGDFTLLQRVAGKTVRMALPIEARKQLPSWTGWLVAYSQAIDYSVRQIRRLVLGEQRPKVLKKCPWSRGQHERVLDAAVAGFELVSAIEAGVDTTGLCDRIKKIMVSIPRDMLDSEYEETRRRVRKRPPRHGTE